MIQEAFQKLRTNLELNDTFDVLIQQRHNAVRSVIENNMGTVNTKLIGSLQRKTRIQPKQNGTFDIDILVVLGSFYNWLPLGAPGGVTPAAAMQTLHEAVNESDRYRAMGPQQDQPTDGDGRVADLRQANGAPKRPASACAAQQTGAATIVCATATRRAGSRRRRRASRRRWRR